MLSLFCQLIFTKIKIKDGNFLFKNSNVPAVIISVLTEPLQHSQSALPALSVNMQPRFFCTVHMAQVQLNTCVSYL